MFNMGFTELLFLAVIALVVIGPKQLPEVARALASLINEFKRATGDLTESMTQIKSDVDSAIKDVSKEVSSGVTSPEEWITQTTQELEKKELEKKDPPIKNESEHDS